MGRKCEFSDCINREGKNCGKSFFSFPREFNRCKQWVDFCRSQQLSEEFINGSQNVKKRVLCADHFDHRQFKQSALPEYGLCNNAVPTLPEVLCSVGLCMQSAVDESSDDRLNASIEYDEIEFLENSSSEVEYESIEYLDSSPPHEQFSSNEHNIETRCLTTETLVDLAIDLAIDPVNPETSISNPEWPIPQPILSPEDSSEHPQTDFLAVQPSYSNMGVEGRWSNDDVNFTHNPSENESFPDKPDFESLFLAEKKVTVKLRHEMKEIKREWQSSNQKAKRKDRWRLKSMKRSRRIIKNLKTELKLVKKRKSSDEKLGKLVRANPVLHNSLLNSSKKPKGRRYNNAMKKFSRGAYLAGPAAFRFVQRSKVLNLPNKNTIGRWNASVSMKTGLNISILNRLGAKMKSFTKKEKAVVVSIDGMTIKPELTYNAKTDTFVGFPSVGGRRRIEKNNPMTLATEAIVVMISGLGPLQATRWETYDKNDRLTTEVSRRFKQAIGYELAHNTLGSKDQLDLIKRTVQSLRLRGMYPLVLTMDQCTTNVKMAKEIGSTEQNPVVQIEGTKMAIMFDTPHLLKSARNMLLKHNAVFAKQIASFSWIKQLFDIDHCSVPRLVPKLKEEFINMPPFAAMNVSKATRTLSSSVAKGIQFYVETKELPSDALGTATFADFFDKIFDCFNSKSSQNERKVYRGVITNDSCHWQFFEEALQLLKKMYFTKNTCFDVKKALRESKDLTVKQRNPNFVSGFIRNIHALRWLWDKLHDEFGYDNLQTNHINQDPNENLFSEIRRRCGRNDSPNAVQFAAAFKSAAISANEKIQNGSNCESDNALPLCNGEDFEIEDLWEMPECSPSFKYKFRPLNPDEPENFTVREINGLTYILGAAVAKLPHTKCRKQLIVAREELDESDQNYRFCKMKNASYYPSTQLFQIGILAFRAFKQKFRKFLYQNRQERGIVKQFA